MKLKIVSQEIALSLSLSLSLSLPLSPSLSLPLSLSCIYIDTISFSAVTVVHQLNWVITYLLTASNNISLLSRSIHTLSFTLARWQLFFPSIFLPPILTAMEGTSITMQLLDQSLVDSDILQEYMQRSNLIGWRSRNHFEELWMQLLGVLNTPPPSSGTTGIYWEVY